jgi:endonuclease-8
MPEGDTIFRTARALNRAIGGRVVTGFETTLAPLARVNDDAPLVGRTVEHVEARGKWCLIFFSGDLILLTHMRMSGSWHIYKTGERWQAPRSAMRIVITCGDIQAIAFNVPVAEFHTARSLERSAHVSELGADVLSPTYRIDEAVHALRDYGRAHPDAEIGDLLLNQRVIAGIGNIYKSETLFAAQVNPFRRVQTVSDRELERIAEIAQRYMKTSVAEAESEGTPPPTGNRGTTGGTGPGARRWVYRRQGQECRRCGAVIEMRRQGVGARSTYWCPSCQPWMESS